MRPIIFNFLILISVMIITSTAVKIEKGWITLDSVTGQSSDRYKIDLSSSLKQVLNLTQSSRIKIEAKITFSTDEFFPQFFSFRLRHNIYESVSQPVLAQWDSEDQVFKAVIDLGDPKQISHLSGDYKLEVIISDDKLNQQIRKYIANAEINFRHSLDKPISSELHYTASSIIMTEAPAQRIDPPQIFTGFVALLIVVLFGVWILGLNFQKVNFSLFPSGGVGLIINLLFVGCLGVIFFMLVKFWVNWTFIDTFQYFVVIILPAALAANFAFLHVKKQ